VVSLPERSRSRWSNARVRVTGAVTSFKSAQPTGMTSPNLAIRPRRTASSAFSKLGRSPCGNHVVAEGVISGFVILPQLIIRHPAGMPARLTDGGTMSDTYTDEARRVLGLAATEARQLCHESVGPEHLLLGMIRDGQNLGTQILASMEISLPAIRQHLETTAARGLEPTPARIAFSEQARKVLELSRREAGELGQNRVGTGHLLLGLIGEGESAAARVLAVAGADLNGTRAQVILLQVTAAGSARVLVPAQAGGIAEAAGGGKTPGADQGAGFGERPEPMTGRPGSRHQLPRVAITAALAVVLLAVAGVATRAEVNARPLASADRQLMRMQRMGPPFDLQGGYQELREDTAALRDPRTGRVVGSGIYVQDQLILASLPPFLSRLPANVRRLMELTKSDTYAVIFIAPLQEITSRTLLVDTAGTQLPGVVIGTDQALDLAAVDVTMTQSQISGLVGPPLLAAAPRPGALELRRLILRRNPALFSRSVGYVLTAATLHGSRRGQCATAVSGADSGAPLLEVTATGEIGLIGLAVPATAPMRCAVLGAWTFGPFLSFVTSAQGASKTAPPGGTGAYLGVLTQTTASARDDHGYRGRAVGAYVVTVLPGAAADTAGLRPGDVIIGLDGKAVRTNTVLGADVQRLQPGRSYPLTFVRQGRAHKIRVVPLRAAASGGPG
jgi:Clp amino terminal domain, pathogenicity island component/PDZ domain